MHQYIYCPVDVSAWPWRLALANDEIVPTNWLHLTCRYHEIPAAVPVQEFTMINDYNAWCPVL